MRHENQPSHATEANCILHSTKLEYITQLEREGSKSNISVSTIIFVGFKSSSSEKRGCQFLHILYNEGIISFQLILFLLS